MDALLLTHDDGRRIYRTPDGRYYVKRIYPDGVSYVSLDANAVARYGGDESWR